MSGLSSPKARRAALGVGAALLAAASAQGKPKPLAPAPAAAPAPPPAAGAPGQAQTGNMMGFSSNLPYDATADTMEQFRDQHLIILKGNVEVIQGDVRIRTPELRLYSSEKPAAAGAPQPTPGAIGPTSGFGAIERMEAAGPVYYITPTQQARGDQAVYEKAVDTITMIGNVVVTQDKNVVSGDKLIVEQKTGHATLVSNTTGLNKPKRVRGVFYPQQAPPGAPGAPAAAAPSLFGAPAAKRPRSAPPPPASAPKPG